MKTLYNIYHKYNKINKRMISKKEMEQLLNQKFIYKKRESGEIEKIPTEDLTIKKCTII